MRVRRLPFSGSYTLLAVCDSQGEPELLRFFEGLGANLEKNADHMLQLLERVAVTGPPRNTDVSHLIQDDIWEFIKGRLRVFWFYDEGRVVVCTHGIVKKSQKTPKQAIEHAKQAREVYFAAKRCGALRIEEEDDDER